jgi:hypothetical protein
MNVNMGTLGRTVRPVILAIMLTPQAASPAAPFPLSVLHVLMARSAPLALLAS